MTGTKKLMAMVRPTKPINEMTDEEIAGLADELFEVTKARFGGAQDEDGSTPAPETAPDTGAPEPPS